MRPSSCLAVLLGLAAACAATSAPREPRSIRSSGSASGSAQGTASGEEIHVDAETFMLPNGARVTLAPDRSLPKVVINTWFAVGSKDEQPGRSGFAHLFEHLMFMGTARVPDNQFDVLMERGGGSNNATTDTDRTNYFSMGPSSLLPTLLWLDADRLEGLDEAMTQEKLDLQREVVRNERRQSSENVPYGKARLLLPELLYPEGHPYHHPVIGSHADLEAAELEDVVDFFRTYYVPGNASLVVAGDFDPEPTRELVKRLFGAVPIEALPEHRSAPPVRLAGETRAITTDRVEFPKLYLVWHSPAAYAPGDAEMDLAATILADGPSSRLQRRLVLDQEIAQRVDAFQASSELGSTFHVEVLAAPGADLERIRRETLAVLDAFAREGPTAAELERAQAQAESRFLRGMESLLGRADSMNAYLHHFGVADGFQRDLERYTEAARDDVRRTAADVLAAGHVDLRVLPGASESPPGALDERPAEFPIATFTPPLPETFELPNGVAVHAIPRPGARLFSGALIVAGGEESVGRERAGLASLAASLLESGAGGLDASEYAAAGDSLGASIGAGAGRTDVSVRVSGLTSRMPETLDLFADLVLRPNLEPEDFAREQRLALAAIAARKDNPTAVTGNVARALLFGQQSALGRPVEGYEDSVAAIDLAELGAAVPRLLDPARATFVFAGDFELSELRRTLEERFAGWRSPRSEPVEASAALVQPPPGRIVLVDRPDAPQTTVYILRPAPPAEDVERAARDCVATIFGGSFTSRLNQNLREKNGYSYGASSRVLQEDEQYLLLASSAVRTDVTGAALAEFRTEFDRMAKDGVSADELAKAVETLRRRLVETAETTDGMARTLIGLVSDGRPLDAVARDLAALDGVGLEAANKVAGSGLFRWQDLTVVLVGDRASIVPQLEEHGFPEPAEADPEGRLQQ